MANGIDWFRWHHGSVNDPKFGLVAKKAGARVGDVIAVWALVLELASANTDRGAVSEIDHEATDFLLGAADGTTAKIIEAMEGRGLIAAARVVRWETRQPKREREDTNAAERKRLQREREAMERQQEPSHTTSHHVTPREEKRREELTSRTLVPGDAGDEQSAPLKLVGKPDCPHQAIIEIYHEVLPQCPRIRDWTPARQQHLRARWNEDSKRQNLDYWRRFFGYVASCDFLVGKGGGPKPFMADLEWIVTSKNFTKIREEKYENRKAV